MLTGTVSLNASTSFAAFDRWAELQKIRGKSMEETLKKVMRLWISFAIAKIAAGDGGKIRADLMKLRRGYQPPKTTKGGKIADKYRGTVAAWLVQRLNWGGANQATNKRGQHTPAFYGTVGRFINARVFSKNLHKAGWKPTLAALRAKTDSGIPNYRKMPGSYVQQIDDWAASLIAENFASAAQRPGAGPPLGIAGLAPNMLEDSEPEVAAMLEKWLAADLKAAAARSGFFAS